MSSGFGQLPHSGPEPKPEPEPKPSSPVPSNVRLTRSTTVRLSSVKQELPAQPPQKPPSEDSIRMQDNESKSSGKGSEHPRRLASLYTFSPPTRKRGRGRLPRRGMSLELVSGPGAALPLQESPIIGGASQHEHERDGGHSPNNQLSQTINTANNSDDRGESCPASKGVTVQVCSYNVNPIFAPTLQAILHKHGDIAQDSPLKSTYMRNSMLEGICKVVEELQGMDLTNLNETMLNAYHSAVGDAEVLKLNVEWLRQRLDEIHEARKTFEHTLKLIDEVIEHTEMIENLKKDIQLKKLKLEKLKSSIEAKESSLVMETQQNERLTSNFRIMLPEFQHFQNNLLDGLL